jgi:hypothetical protein
MLQKAPKGHPPAVSTPLDAAVVKRLDALAPLVAPRGSKPSRAMAIRACILTGLDVLEAKHAKGSR